MWRQRLLYKAAAAALRRRLQAGGGGGNGWARETAAAGGRRLGWPQARRRLQPHADRGSGSWRLTARRWLSVLGGKAAR